MVPQEAPYPDVYTDTFIFFLRPLCKIIWINVHYFPNAPRISFYTNEKERSKEKNDKRNGQIKKRTAAYFIERGIAVQIIRY